jgi:hypothetical protein
MASVASFQSGFHLGVCSSSRRARVRREILQTGPFVLARRERPGDRKAGGRSAVFLFGVSGSGKDGERSKLPSICTCLPSLCSSGFFCAKRLRCGYLSSLFLTLRTRSSRTNSFRMLKKKKIQKKRKSIHHPRIEPIPA